MVAAARLNDFITLQNNIKVRTASGAELPTWLSLATVRAEVIYLKGAERLQGAALAVVAPVQVLTYYRADITEESRILHEGRTLEIVQKTPYDRKKRFMLLQCDIGRREGL